MDKNKGIEGIHKNESTEKTGEIESGQGILAKLRSVRLGIKGKLLIALAALQFAGAGISSNAYAEDNEEPCYVGEPCCEELAAQVGETCGVKPTTTVIQQVVSEELKSSMDSVVDMLDRLNETGRELSEKIDSFEPTVEVIQNPAPISQNSSVESAAAGQEDPGGWAFTAQLGGAVGLGHYAEENPFYMTAEAGARWLSRSPNMNWGVQAGAGAGIWTAEGTAVPVTEASAAFLAGDEEILTRAGVQYRAVKSPYKGDGWYSATSLEAGVSVGLPNDAYLDFSVELPVDTDLKRQNGVTLGLGIGVKVDLP